VIPGLFPKRVTDAVLDAMTDHEKPSMQVLDDPERQRDFALLILRLLTAGTGDQRTITTRPAQ
jgi:type I restriction enzyme R subunit